MRRRSLVVAAISVAALAGACAPAPTPPVSGLVAVAPPGREALHLTYLGVGGWIMEYDGVQILGAPLFSNPGVVRTGLSRIAVDTAAVDRYMGRYDVRGARAILVGHAHYDHLMDVPRVAAVHAPRAVIVGGPTVRHMLGSWSGVADRVEVVTEAHVGDQETVGRWMPLGDRLRVMPLRSLHGPHFDGITLYRGALGGPLEAPPGHAADWVEGETYAYLIDFLGRDGCVAFRVYYQDAVAPPPLGLAPDLLITERPVDVAVIVPATFEEVEWHPEALVRNLRPDRVLMGHWENFFLAPVHPPRPVPLTDLGAFEQGLRRTFSGDAWRPLPFTGFRLPRRSGPEADACRADTTTASQLTQG